MKTKNFTLFALYLLLFCPFVISAQVQSPVYVTMTPHTNAYYEYLPQGYSATGTTRYPLMIFFHGSGETGPGTPATLPTVLRNGPPKLIANGTFPTGFTVNNVNYKFIVISPQFTEWPTAIDVDGVMSYLIAHYPVDTSRIYLTGLSMGGGVVWDYIGSDINRAKRIAAVLPVCGAQYPYQSYCETIAASNLPVWGTHNSIDPTVPVYYTVDHVNLINASPVPPSPLAKMTIFTVPTANHDAWTATYDPAFKEDNLNVYEWMLQFRRSFSVLPVTGLLFNNPVVESGRIKLQWSTLTEVNTPNFTILRSVDGINFNSIGIVSSSSINGTGATYTFLDQNPLSGINFYRVQVQDEDGTKSFSEIRKAMLQKNIGLSVFPNPAEELLNISANISLTGASLKILNATGQLVRTQVLAGGQTSISVSALIPGVYYVVVKMKDDEFKFQFIKK